MGKKKENDPVEALKKAFQEEVNDNELQERYDGFQRNLEYFKEQHNKLVPQINENLETIRSLQGIILESAMHGILATEAVVKIKELELQNQTLIKDIQSYKERIDYNKDLLEKYKDWSDRKLFIWWQALKAVDPSIEAWLEWKETFKDKII